MKRYLPFFLMFLALSVFAQEGKKAPDFSLDNIDGDPVTLSENTGSGPVVLSFWATWCKPCKKELDAIAEEYANWVKETGVKLIAVSIDDARGFSKVGPEVKTKGWDYEVYVDENQDFKRAMSVNSVPHTFVIDGKGNVVWQHNSYAEGDEDALYEVVKKVAKGEKVNE